MLYGMGMLELGKMFSYTQLIIDDEIANMVRRVVKGVDVTDSTMGVDVIRSVGGGQGKHFLMEEHTLEYMKTEQQAARFFNRRTYDTWLSEGAKDAAVRAHEKALHIFHTHKPEPLSQAVLAELQRIVESAEK